MYAEILIEYNNKTIDKTFTYLIPKTLENKIKVVKVKEADTEHVIAI